MVQVNFALKEQFSWQDYCASFANTGTDGWGQLPEPSRLLLESLNLSTIHPHCVSQRFDTDAPLMGPLSQHDYHESVWDALVTTWKQASPTLFAMGELWLRLFAALLAPLGIAYLVWSLLAHSHQAKPIKAEQSHNFRITLASMLTLASSAVLATDMWYVYQYGPGYGISLLVASSLLTSIIATRHRLLSVGIVLLLIWSLTIKLSFKNGTFQFGGDELPLNIPEGLYYNHQNPLVHKLVQNWPVETRTYSAETGATSWTVTGDTRTGIPFLVNDAFPWPDLELTKLWIPTVDDEAVRLEVAFPPQGGHRSDKAVYVVLHGLSGGSQEEFIKDHVHRATARGHTVIIMIARGLMDTPIKGWNVFQLDVKERCTRSLNNQRLIPVVSMADQSLDNDQDEAMEWITEWEYERHGTSDDAAVFEGRNRDDASIAMDEDEEEDEDSVDEDDDAPLPLDHPIDPRHESSQEIAIFWTRATEELTDDDLTEMFDLAPPTHATNSRRNSRNSMVSLMEAQPPREDDEDSIMGPLQDKEGLLPPMSPSHLYQPQASFGLMDVHKVTVGHAFPSDSMATHTTVDLMDDDQSDDGFDHSTVSGDGIFERQQRLLQEVLEQAPASAAAMRQRTQLPQPSDDQRKLLQEMKLRKKPQDPIFARQQQIFQQMRIAERAKIQPPENHFYTPYSPVSVTRTLTRAGMDSEEYHRVVARLTQKNLIERQRVLLQQSMKRSLETRQALHIKPTALPDYNHDKLSQVLKDIESSSRSISETYGRR